MSKLPDPYEVTDDLRQPQDAQSGAAAIFGSCPELPEVDGRGEADRAELIQLRASCRKVSEALGYDHDVATFVLADRVASLVRSRDRWRARAKRAEERTVVASKPKGRR